MIKKSISEKIALPLGSFDEKHYRTVKDAISDLEDVEPVVERLQMSGQLPLPLHYWLVQNGQQRYCCQ